MKKKTVVITGGNRGIGFAFVSEYCRRGYTVIATARKPARASELHELHDAVREQLHVVQLDLEDGSSVATFADRVQAIAPQVDILVNNAGINSRALGPADKSNILGEATLVGMRRMFHVNAVGPLLVTQALADLLAKAGGKVAFISSFLGSINNKAGGGNYGYATSKAALNMVGRTAAHDLAKRGVAAVILNPGWVRTKMGGPDAPLGAEESVTKMAGVIDALSLETTGAFLSYEGEPVSW